VIFTASPVADIHNLRRVGTVIKEGKTIARERLPEMRVLSSPKS